jgi:hypothetical protein
MKTFWRFVKLLLGLSLLGMGGINLFYIMNDSVAGYAAGHPYRNQEFIGTGVLVGLGILLIYLSFLKKRNDEDEFK